VRVELGTDIADPGGAPGGDPRPDGLVGGDEPGGQRARAGGLAQQAPSAAIAATSKMLRSASALLGNWTPLANCAIANVPGPQVPLYLQGARLSYLSAIMPIADGMGLVFSVTSYNDMLIVSFTACYEQLPDPEQLAQACATASRNTWPCSSRRRGASQNWPWWPAQGGGPRVPRPSRRGASRPCARRSERWPPPRCTSNTSRWAIPRIRPSS
jgi:diacylglycerol O-acyltransferase